MVYNETQALISKMTSEGNMHDAENLGSLVKRQRIRLGLTLPVLSSKSEVSASHLSRIEKAQRYPSVNVLRKIAEPLGLDEKELFNLAGYLPSEHPMSPDQEKHRLLAELDILLNRVTADPNRIKRIIQQLHIKS
jgi:transcriptional regulator with XRE-family HTH domain